MIVELVVLAAVAGVAYFGGTVKGKADVAKLKADVAAELPVIETKVASVEASVKTDVTAAVAKIKALL